MALPFSTAGIAVRIPQKPGHSRATAAIYSPGILLKKSNSYSIISIGKRSVTRGGWRGVAKCGISNWSEGNATLEEEVFQFMEESEKPNHFPSKHELLSAGRSDLVARIMTHGGWLAAGWDSEDFSNQATEEDDTDGDVVDCNGPDEWNGDGLIAQEKPSVKKIIDVSAEDLYQKPENIESKASGIAAILNRLDRERTLFYAEASEGKKRNRLQQSNESKEHWTSVGGMQPLAVNGKRKDDDRNVRLKESRGIFRSQGRETAQVGYKNTELDLGENLGKPEILTIPSVQRMEELETETKGESGVSGAFWQRQKRTGEQISSQSMQVDENRSVVVDKIDEIIENTELDLGENLGKPKILTIPSVQRMEELETETKGESGVSGSFWQRQKRTGEQISSQSMKVDENRSVVADKIDEIIEKRQEWMLNVKTSYSGHSQQIYSSDIPNNIMSRIQKLESQLASTLGSLRSGKEAFDIKKDDDKIALEDLGKASDALEFRETEIMTLRTKLRSTLAKLAVLEGKMAMEIMEVRKAIEEKQKQVDEAQKVLSLLRLARIVWPNSASEVFLVGSFDGWTSQRRMGKSNAGVFVISLHLYPGRYE
ncbi:hypothetical protein KI387_007502, partial [Taxus chinensis]